MERSYIPREIKHVQTYSEYLQQKEKARATRATIFENSILLDSYSKDVIRVLEQSQPGLFKDNRDLDWEKRLFTWYDVNGFTGDTKE